MRIESLLLCDFLLWKVRKSQPEYGLIFCVLSDLRHFRHTEHPSRFYSGRYVQSTQCKSTNTTSISVGKERLCTQRQCTLEVLIKASVSCVSRRTKRIVPQVKAKTNCKCPAQRRRQIKGSANSNFDRLIARAVYVDTDHVISRTFTCWICFYEIFILRGSVYERQVQIVLLSSRCNHATVQ